MYLGLAIRTDLVLMSLFVGPKDRFSVLQCTLNKIDILKTLHMSQVCRRHSYKNFFGSEECQSFSSYENTNYQSQTHVLKLPHVSLVYLLLPVRLGLLCEKLP